MDKNELVKLIEPDPNRKIKINFIIEGLRLKIEKIISENHWDAEFFLGGSVAKGTELNESDIDVFLLFRSEFNPYEIVEYLKKYFPDAREEYSEHPYLTINFDGTEADIVPAYFISEGSKIKTPVDRTPLHVKFIKENLNDNEKKEAKILKHFLKKIGIYGAESSIKGFSGYSAELLIYKFKTFENVLTFFKDKIPPIVVEVKENISSNLSKFKEPLVLVDPVDPNRNVTANVSLNNLSILILASKFFSWDHSEKFFFPDNRMHKVPENALGIAIRCRKCNEDVIISNLRRVGASIIKNAEIFDFKISYYSVFLVGDRGIIVFLADTMDLGEARLHLGPSIHSSNLIDFMSKWNKNSGYGTPFVNGDRIAVIAERKFRKIEDYLIWEIKRNYLAKDFDINSIEILKKEQIERLLPSGILEKNLYFLD